MSVDVIEMWTQRHWLYDKLRLQLQHEQFVTVYNLAVVWMNVWHRLWRGTVSMCVQWIVRTGGLRV